MTSPTLLHGDCMEVLSTLEPDSVDACVTDPPYGLGFMGKHWDRGVPDADVWREVYRVLKPGAHLLSFFGTRTYHRGAVAIEDAGFEIRDQVGWLYGSGFPKSHNISKAIDKAAGVTDRPIIGEKLGADRLRNQAPDGKRDGQERWGNEVGRDPYIRGSVIPEAQQWNGWGTALKPAWEPIVLARKPLEGTVAANVLKWGTGGLNIDGCRVAHRDATDLAESQAKNPGKDGAVFTSDVYGANRPQQVVNTLGRFPANIIHDGSDEVLAEFAKYSDTATAARFFYTAKASKDDRNDGLWDYEHTDAADMVDRKPDSAGMNSPRAGAGRTSGARNHHPTVKPTSLMRYLVRLVTPKGGLVLDPFAGSGTTLIAAYREDCRAIGIEIEKEYFDMAQHRIERATAQMRMVF